MVSKGIQALVGLLFILYVGAGSAFDASPLDVIINAQNVTGVYFKAKLGFARAFTIKELPESLRFARTAEPRAFCSQLDFDGVEERNYALEPSPFSRGGKVAAIRNEWLNKVLSQMSNFNAKLYLQLTGAPIPFQKDDIKRPAIHPTPTNIRGAAREVALWAKPYRNTYPAIQWTIWNEPSHTLRGSPTEAAAREMAEIYHEYATALRSTGSKGEFGLAGFIAHGMKSIGAPAGRSFIAAVLANVMASGDPVHFVAANNYYGSTDELLDHLNGELQKYSSTSPIVLTQYAPAKVTSREIAPGTSRSAIEYIVSYDHFVADPTIQHVCFSYWVGGKQAFVFANRADGSFLQQPNLRALELYQKLPYWRVDARAPEPLRVFAGTYGGKLGALVVNTSTRVLVSKVEVALPLAVVAQNVTVTRLDNGNRMSTEEAKWNEGILQLALGPEEIILLELGDSSVTGTVPIGRFVGSDVFVDRRAGADESEIGFAEFDQVENVFELSTGDAHSLVRARVLVENASPAIEFMWDAPSENEANNLISCGFVSVEQFAETGKSLHFFFGSGMTQKLLVARSGETLFSGGSQRIEWKRNGRRLTGIIQVGKGEAGKGAVTALNVGAAGCPTKTRAIISARSAIVK